MGGNRPAERLDSSTRLCLCPGSCGGALLSALLLASITCFSAIRLHTQKLNL